MALPALLRRIAWLAQPNQQQVPSGFYTDWNEALGFEGRRLMVRWGRTSAGVSQDPAVTTHDLINVTTDLPDNTWVDADFVSCETAFNTFWDAIKSSYAPEITLDEYRWYKFGPNINPPNPPVRVVDKNVAGTSTGDSFPPQVAVSVTEKTALRRRWGRFYLPPPTTSQITADGSGRISAGFLDQIADASEALYEAWKAADFLPVVWSPTIEAAFSVERIQVDDLWDVIRSRRWKNPTVRDSRDI